MGGLFQFPAQLQQEQDRGPPAGCAESPGCSGGPDLEAEGLLLAGYKGCLDAVNGPTGHVTGDIQVADDPSARGMDAEKRGGGVVAPLDLHEDGGSLQGGDAAVFDKRGL